jgi:hypothetical protein
VDAVKRFNGIHVRDGSYYRPGWSDFCVAELARLPANHSFIDALEALYNSIASGSLFASINQANGGAPFLEVRVAVQTPVPFGELNIFSGPASRSVRYGTAHAPSPTRASPEQMARELGRLTAIYMPNRKMWQEIGLIPIQMIATAFADALQNQEQERRAG